jgi:hypothetical protein
VGLELQDKVTMAARVTMANIVVAVAVEQVALVLQTQVMVVMEQVHIQLG